MPDLHALSEGAYTKSKVAPITGTMLRQNVGLIMQRYIQYEPEAAQSLIRGVASQLSRDANSPYAQKYIGLIVKRLQSIVPEDRRNEDENSSYRERHLFLGPYVEQNITEAIAAFDKANLIPTQFWQAILNAPLASQSYLVTTVLADKLQSQDTSVIIIGNVKSYDRLRMIENVTDALLQRASNHTARDQNQLQIIRKAIATENRPDKVSLGKAVKLADTVIRREYPNQLSRLRPEDSFTDAGQALSFLLRLTLRPDTTEEEKYHANQEAETYLNIIQSLAEYSQKPIIRTIGDLALRYTNASGPELEALQKAFFTGGTPKSDALRHQQRRITRRSSITKPGYGIIS